MNAALNRFSVLFAFLVLTGHAARSQEGNPLQFIRSLSQTSRTNPAFQNQDERLVLGLPVLSGVTFDWSANFAADYIFSEHFAYSFNKFYQALDGPGDASPTATIPIFYVSQRKGKQNFSFSLSERMITKTSFDREVLHFIDLGLLPYYGNAEEFGPMSVKAFYFRELAAGYSAEVWDGLTVGIRPKLLFARYFYHVDELRVKVETDTQAQQLLVSPIGGYTISAPLEITYDAEKEATLIRPNPAPTDYFFNFHNLSPAIDLGLQYRFQKSTEIALSVLDLGYLGFKHDTYDINFVAPLGYYTYELYQSNDPDAPKYKEPRIALEEFSDRLPFIISAETRKERIIQRLPLKLMASLKQGLNERMEIGILEQYSAGSENPYNYVTGFFRSSVGKGWDLAASLSLYKTDKLLPGMAASYTGKRAQYFLGTNNITGLVKPSSAKSLNLSFGVNFLFTTYHN